EPLTPVKQIKAPRGRLSEMSRRLCSRAPRITRSVVAIRGESSCRRRSGFRRRARPGGKTPDTIHVFVPTEQGSDARIAMLARLHFLGGGIGFFRRGRIFVNFSRRFYDVISNGTAFRRGFGGAARRAGPSDELETSLYLYHRNPTV